MTARALSGHRVVTVTVDGLDYASALDIAHASAPLWLTTQAWGADVTADVVTQGVVTEPSWSWTVGRLWLGDNGFLVTSIPEGAVFARQVAVIIDATRIEFNPQLAIVTGD